MKQIKAPQMIAGRVSSAGALVASSAPVGVQKGATGLYFFKFPDFRLTSIVAQYNLAGGSNVVAVSTVLTETTAEVSLSLASTGAASDQPFNFIAIGS